MHFTYQQADKKFLCQGDLLARTASIDAVIKEVHPHYSKPDYRYLMVLTQGCDLERRHSGRCKARYISLAAVRPFTLVLAREVEKHQRSPIERRGRICDADARERLTQFLERLFNNNESEFYYLHPEPTVGLDEPYCAFLTLSIPIKSELHYEACLDAKILELKEPFQNKLGWLTGNLYSRIGTDDWVPGTLTKEEFGQMVSQVLDNSFVWVDTERKSRFLKRLKDWPDERLTTQAILSEYEVLKKEIPKKKDLLVERVAEILLDLGVDEETLRKARNRVNGDPEIAMIVKG